MAQPVEAHRGKRAWLMPAGFALSLAGLALATYAYTPPRTYEVAYAGVALVGFLVMFGGIVMAGHARARGGRKRIAKKGAPLAKPALAAKPAPDPAPESPRAPAVPLASRFSFPRVGRKKPASPGLALAFKRKPRPPPAVLATPVAASSARAAAIERFQLQCPRCATTFAAEGARPLAIACPSCGLTGTLTGAPSQAARVDVDLAPAPGAPASSNGDAPLPAGVERVKLQCPRCGAQFAAEGTRPISIACPSCALTGTLK